MRVGLNVRDTKDPPFLSQKKGVALLSDLHCFSDVSELSSLFFMSVVMHGCFYFGDRLRVLFSIESGDTTFDLLAPPITPSGSFMLGGSVCVHLLDLGLGFSVVLVLSTFAVSVTPPVLCVHGAVLVPDMIICQNSHGFNKPQCFCKSNRMAGSRGTPLLIQCLQPRLHVAHLCQSTMLFGIVWVLLPQAFAAWRG